ncbi:MAG TPA: DUF2207 domain-containing protein, partial [Candidatus Saccharibacteria bacterium]|nr:DUF2207 domain-containing protein [Candidatus Saccharibacteria bacterium]
MKKLIFSFVSILFLMNFGSAGVVEAQNVNNFKIDTFVTDYYIEKSDKNVASMRVVEKIVATFPEYDQNHGIIRAIPNEYKNKTLNLKVQSILNENGTPHEYSVSESNDNTILKIGNANRYVHGQTTYIISYKISNFISFEDSHDEFYWDVNGNEWAQPVGKVTAKVHIPSSVGVVEPDLQKCFTGGYGVKESLCDIKTKKDKNGELVTVTANGLSPYETLTFVLGFPKGTFEPDKMAALIGLVIMIIIVLSAVLPILLTLVIVISKWRKRGRDPKGKGIVIPEYIAPKNMDVVISDVVLNERMTPKAITAGIIELATTKYITLYEIKKDKLIGSKTEYEIELVKKEYPKSAQLKAIIIMIFGSTGSVGNRV